ncbi:MAG: tyrosine-type recombinase/integrase [Lachnospirales bacterium]
MIEDYYKDKRKLKLFRECLFGEYLDDFTNYFIEHDYSVHTVRSYLRTALSFSRFLMWEGLTDVHLVNQQLSSKFLNEHLPYNFSEKMNCGIFSEATAGISHLMSFLETQGIIEPNVVLEQKTEMSEMLRKYDIYLDTIFGLSDKTRKVHRIRATVFMKWVKENTGELKLENLTNENILDFQKEIQDNKFSIAHKRTITMCLRGFLRFLRWERILEKDLTPAVYCLIEWDLASIPKYMPYDDVLLLLQAPDRNTSVGKRDVVILMLLAYLGLRASEIINLNISDIDFHNGTIRISKTKTNSERLMPLTIELAEMLIDYIKCGIHNPKYDALFLRTYAPHTPIEASSAVGRVVSKYINELGLKTPTLGSHQIRHSLATHLINNGSTMKDVADMLGHKSIESTGIYAKVQVERLKEVPLAFPGGVL